MSRGLLCEECDEVKPTMRALYWHYRYEHDLSHEEAFEAVRLAVFADGDGLRVNESSAASRLPERSAGEKAWAGEYGGRFWA